MDELHSLIKSKTKNHSNENFIMTLKELIYKTYNNKPPKNIKNIFKKVLSKKEDLTELPVSNCNDNDVKSVINHIINKN